MPNVTGPLLSLSASKTIKKTLTFQTRRGQGVVYGYKKPGDVTPLILSTDQELQREKFGAIVWKWKQMTDEQHEEWNNEAIAKNYVGTGYHLFVSTYGGVGKGWYNGFKYRKECIINKIKVIENTTDFRCLISIIDEDLKTKCLPSGIDIIFTDSDQTTPLKYYIESFDQSTGTLISWVKIPSLTNSENYKIYMYYGNPSADYSQDPVNTLTKYLSVWSLNGDFTNMKYSDKKSGYDQRYIHSDIVQQSGTSLISAGDVAGVDYVSAQSFLPTKVYFSGIRVYKNTTVGTPTGDLKFEIRTDNGGNPSGTVLVSKTYTLAQWNAYGNGGNFIPLPCTLVVDGFTKYWIVFKSTVANEPSNNSYKLGYYSISNVYPNGVLKQSSNNESSWNVLNYALNFTTYYVEDTVAQIYRGNDFVTVNTFDRFSVPEITGSVLGNQFALSFIFKRNAVQNHGFVSGREGTNKFNYYTSNDSIVLVAYDAAASAIYSEAIDTIPDGNFHKYTLIINVDHFSFVRDNVVVKDNVSLNGTMRSDACTNGIMLGFALSGSNRWMNGVCEDFTVIVGSQTIDYPVTEYNNQFSPATFMSWGQEI